MKATDQINSNTPKKIVIASNENKNGNTPKNTQSPAFIISHAPTCYFSNHSNINNNFSSRLESFSKTLSLLNDFSFSINNTLPTETTDTSYLNKDKLELVVKDVVKQENMYSTLQF